MTVFEKGEKIYKRLKAKLEIMHKGEVVAIEPKSGQFVVAKDELAAALAAVERFPGKIFTFFRIGSPVMHKLRRQK